MNAVVALQKEVNDIKRRMTLMENGHLGTSKDHPGYRILIAKLQATEKAISIVNNLR